MVKVVVPQLMGSSTQASETIHRVDDRHTKAIEFWAVGDRPDPKAAVEFDGNAPAESEILPRGGDRCPYTREIGWWGDRPNRSTLPSN